KLQLSFGLLSDCGGIRRACFAAGGIFPSLAFDAVELAEDDEFYTCEGLMNNKHPCRAQPASPSSTSTRHSEPATLKIPLLKRGRSVRADQFLDSLEIVFEALQRGTLHAFGIPFLGDPEISTDPLELWSFRIIYKKSANGKREVQGLETNLGNQDVFNPSLEIDGYVMDLLGRVSDQCEELTQLPDDCYIQPSIMYTNDGWKPSGYVETQSQPSVEGFAGWRPQVEDIGLRGGVLTAYQSCHSTYPFSLALRVASLKHQDSNTRRLAQDLRMRRTTAGQEEQASTKLVVTTVDTSTIRERTFSPGQGRRSSAISAIPETPQHVVRYEEDIIRQAVPSAPLQATGRLPQDAAALLGAPGDQDPDTAAFARGGQPHSRDPSVSQADDDVRRRSSLDNMMHSNSNGHDDFATQIRLNASQMANDRDEPSAELVEHMRIYDFLTREKALQLWGKRSEKSIAPTDQSITRCRCQLSDSREEMHSICQGYILDDGRQPPKHVCHICLLELESDSDSLESLRDLALERRAMDLLLSREAEDTVESGTKLAIRSDEVTKLVASLTSQGLVVEQGRRHTRNSQAKVTLPDSVGTPEYIGLLAQFFDPHRIVGHHFSGRRLSDGSGTLVAQALKVKYPTLAQSSSKVIPAFLPERKRAATARATKKAANDKDIAPKKRARTGQLEVDEEVEHATPARRSPRVRTLTPKMKEAKFGMFINGRNLPSRENPEIKSKRFKGDS
ncbi:hypothetical protein E4T42_05692, partial [Aureobasidium subglaciale]